MSTQESDRPIVGHHAAWGMTPSRSDVRPYTVTPGATEMMSVRVREKIDIRGVGTDVVQMVGIFIVRRDHACPCPAGDHNADPKWAQCIISTEFRSLELYGESPVFGTIRVHLDPEHVSDGEVGPGDDGSLAASCVAHCHAVFELPELDLELTTGGVAVELASKVIQVPPIGDVARSENSVSLIDEGGNVMGEIISSDIEVGEVLFSIPLGNTGPKGAGLHEPHSKGEHASHFYAKAPTGQPRARMPRAHEQLATYQPPQQPERPIAAESDIASILGRLEAEINGLTEVLRRNLSN